MNASVCVEELSFPADARGFVLEPLDPERLRLQQNVHIAFTEAGAIRGNHFHLHGTEITVVAGPALVRFREGAHVREVIIEERRAFRFTFPPGVSHAFRNTGHRPIILVSFSTAPFDQAAPDVHSEILIAPGD